MLMSEKEYDWAGVVREMMSSNEDLPPKHYLDKLAQYNINSIAKDMVNQALFLGEFSFESSKNEANFIDFWTSLKEKNLISRETTKKILDMLGIYFSETKYGKTFPTIDGFKSFCAFVKIDKELFDWDKFESRFMSSIIVKYILKSAEDKSWFINDVLEGGNKIRDMILPPSRVSLDIEIDKRVAKLW